MSARQTGWTATSGIWPAAQLSGEDIALWLAENGGAFPYRDCKCEVIRAAVDRAESRNINIWSGDVQEPWEWRKAK